MPATPRDEFLKKVLKHVDNEPKSVLEIAKRANVSWQAAKRALETLENLGVIKSKKVGERILYYKMDRPDDTWFRIPIRDEHRKILEYIYARASDEYRRLTGKQLGRTQAQKIAVRVIKNAGLDIPTPRYLYGRVTLLTFEKQPANVSLEPSLAETLEQHIRDAVRWTVGKEGKQIAKAQYEEENNKLHRTLMEIEKELNGLVRGKAPRRDLNDLLMDLLAYVPDDTTVVEAVKELISHRWLLKKEYNEDPDKDGVLKFKSLFDAARHIIAKEVMYRDLKLAGFSDEDLELLRNAKEFSILEFKYLLNAVDELFVSEQTKNALEKIRTAVDDQETREWKEKGSEILRKLGFD